MIKRIVIAGSRDFENYALAKGFIDLCISDISKKYRIIFISGGCRGADALGEKYRSGKWISFRNLSCRLEKIR